MTGLKLNVWPWSCSPWACVSWWCWKSRRGPRHQSGCCWSCPVGTDSDPATRGMFLCHLSIWASDRDLESNTEKIHWLDTIWPRRTYICSLHIPFQSWSPSFAAIIALALLECGFCAYSTTRVLERLGTDVRWGGLECSRHSNSSKKCSVRLRSGLHAGHSSSFTLTLTNHVYGPCFETGAAHMGVTVRCPHSLNQLQWSHSLAKCIPINEQNLNTVHRINTFYIYL